jgi:glycosyltransferase involved in cell wall biosynthesis
MKTAEITPVILTYNEEPNLRRCLEGIAWAQRIVVVDSGSTDATLAICREFPKVEVFHRPFDNHTDQWNYGVGQVQSDWVLSLDADYVATEVFAEEVLGLVPGPELAACLVPFRYCVLGKPLRGSLYPPRAALFRRDRCRYVADGHTQLLNFPGQPLLLQSRLDHDDRKPLSRWLDSQRKYALLEAEKMSNDPGSAKGMPDRLRRMIWPAAPAAFLYTLVVKGLLLDGWPGLFYVLQRTYAELLLSLQLLDRKLSKK